jgi:hypothetical protein
MKILEEEEKVNEDASPRGSWWAQDGRERTMTASYPSPTVFSLLLFFSTLRREGKL